MSRLLCCALLLGLASAQPVLDPARTAVSLGADSAIALPGSLRVYGARLAAIETDPLDAENAVDERTLGEARLRFQPALIYRGSGGVLPLTKIALDGEVVAPFGDAGSLDFDPRVQRHEDGVTPRLNQAYAFAAGRHLAFQLGLVRPRFGLGLLSNPGEDPARDQTRENPFGFRRSLDRHMTARVAFFPLAPTDHGPPLTLLVGADAVISEDNIEWSDGDRTYQGVLGVALNRPAYAVSLGFVYRQQEHAEGGQTDVGITAASVRLEHALARATLFAEAEALAYFGETSFAESAVRPGAYDVFAAGGVLRLGAVTEALDGVVEAGLASGDRNPFDTEVHEFSFDSNTQVGLLMFGEVLRAHSATAAANVADPRYRGNPPRGFERTATDGAVRNAVYLYPRIAYRALEWLTLHAAYLTAWSEEPLVDVYRTGLAGGEPIAPLGARDAHGLGQEIDLGLAVGHVFGTLDLRGLVQFAYFSPGDALADPDGNADDVWGLWLGTEVRW